ncbi:odorant receptor 131-2-like [Pholidichthys leucotaenia]
MLLPFFLQMFPSNPRYILFIHLVVNDTIQLALSIFLYISYGLYTIIVPVCMILVSLATMTTLNTPINLAAMAIECYIAISMPLRHSQICTVKKTYILIGLIWVANSLSVLPDIFFVLATEPLFFFYSEDFCSNNYVFRNSYSSKKKEVSKIICFVFVWLTLMFTYFRIMFAAKGVTGNTKKARNTILLHGFQVLLCMLTYGHPMMVLPLLSLFPQYYPIIQFTNYVIVHVLPRLVSPIVYGLRDKTFRMYVRRYLLFKVRTETSPENLQ